VIAGENPPAGHIALAPMDPVLNVKSLGKG
jgi:hypothetical protein